MALESEVIGSILAGVTLCDCTFLFSYNKAYDANISIISAWTEGILKIP